MESGQRSHLYCEISSDIFCELQKYEFDVYAITGLHVQPPRKLPRVLPTAEMSANREKSFTLLSLPEDTSPRYAYVIMITTNKYQ